MRLLYVSLTRAKNRCYLVWGRFKDAETSSIAYILHPPGDSVENVVEETENHFKELEDETIRQELEALPGSQREIFCCRICPGLRGRRYPRLKRRGRN